MSAQATESVVQIVDDNEQNVSLVDRAVSKGWIVRRKKLRLRMQSP